MIEAKAYAKINLALDILSKREDGYHDVKMIMQQIPLCDTLYIDMMSVKDILNVMDESVLDSTLPLYAKGKRKRGCGYLKLTSNDISLPLDENNLVYKAASLIFEEITFHFPPLITIHINKKIPMAAGLAGGSADAAATLIGMNDFFELNLSQDQLLEKAASIGADVPFCLLGGTALAEGKGEKLTKINGLQGFTIVLSKPDISVSTPWAYALYDEESPSLNIDKPNIDSLLLELNKQSYLNKINKSNISEVIFDESKFARSSFPNSNLTESCLSKSELTESSLAESALDTISKNMINVFEPIVSNSRLEIKETIELFKSFNPFKTMMSGSGPTVFSLFINKSDAKEAYDKLKEINKETYIFEMEEF